MSATAVAVEAFLAAYQALSPEDRKVIDEQLLVPMVDAAAKATGHGWEPLRPPCPEPGCKLTAHPQHPRGHLKHGPTWPDRKERQNIARHQRGT